MSNLFKKVRIVHSPLEKRYRVEQKGVFGLKWMHVDWFDYVDVGDSSPHGCHRLRGDAFDKAKKLAETLLARTVVWEQTNYFWGE